MGKLPSVFHTNKKYITNNKNTFNTFNEKESIIDSDSSNVNEDDLINYFNKKITITLKNGNLYSGVLISKRDNKILLDTKEYIFIDDILKIN